MQGSDGRSLLASIHDVGPGFEREVDTLAELLSGILGGPKFAMLVVPDHWGQHPIHPNTAFARRLRAWAESGVEIFVHGWYHQDACEHRGAAAFKASFMTANEGEFLGLPLEEATRRMNNGKALVEEIIGQEVAGFIAPAWLYGQGALDALRASSSAIAEDHMRVWSPLADRILAQGPVITWASRSAARTASSLWFAGLARLALHPLKTVRIAVHPGDVTKEAILRSIEKTLRAFTMRRPVGRYQDLLRQR